MRTVFALAAVFGVYVLAGKAGLALAFVNASASAVWPPTGIALAAALVLGTRVWPAIALGAFVVNVTTAGSPLSSLSIATGNTLEALVAAALVRRYANGIHAFDRPQDVLKFTMLAAAGTAISATIGVTTLGVGGYAAWADFGAIWLTWWLGDISGALIVAPTVVLWATRPPALPEDAGRRIELAGLVVVAVMVALVTFGPVGPLGPQHYPITFLPFPILVWAAFRFGPLQAASLISLLSVIAIGGTLQGAGPFGAYPPNDALVLLQAFTTVATLTTLTLGAAVLDRDRAQERARQAEERLRRAEEQKVLAREEFLSVAAHELKTPMTTLHIAVQSLLRQLDREGAVDTGALRRALAAVRENTDKLARLVTELLETARANVGRLELERAEADITALVATAVERAQARAPRRRFSLTSRPPPLPSTVDALRLEQVLDNVLDNAIKFSPEGGAIEVTLALTAPQQVRITVRDHGVGIPLERRARIFERFYQAHLELQRSGLGLGLYVAREIVQLHGGRIVAEFPDDGGTRIVIDLPLSREARPADTGVVAATRER